MARCPRRVFLRSGLGLGGSLLVGGACTHDAAGPAAADCSDAFDGGVQLGTAAFVGESSEPLEVAFNAGLDGRLYTDLTKLDPEHLLTPNDAFYVRTRYPDLLMPEARWRLSVSAPGAAPRELLLDELLPLATPRGAQLMECSGNARAASFGLLSSAEWTGIPLLELIERLEPPAATTRLLVSGFDGHSMPSAGNRSVPGASWVFRFDELEQSGAFLATAMNGASLPADHGAPVRLVVPGWYGCTCIKWVNALAFVTDDEPATSQMQEFAARTHQDGVPALARDYQPAAIDLAAMPVRVEKWLVAERILYRVVGIQWGGSRRAQQLDIRFGDGPWQRMAVCDAASPVTTWALWHYAWQPGAPGVYAIVLRAADPSIRTRRLDTGYYLREVAIDEV